MQKGGDQNFILVNFCRPFSNNLTKIIFRYYLMTSVDVEFVNFFGYTDFSHALFGSY